MCKFYLVDLSPFLPRENRMLDVLLTWLQGVVEGELGHLALIAAGSDVLSSKP